MNTFTRYEWTNSKKFYSKTRVKKIEKERKKEKELFQNDVWNAHQPTDRFFLPFRIFWQTDTWSSCARAMCFHSMCAHRVFLNFSSSLSLSLYFEIRKTDSLTINRKICVHNVYCKGCHYDWECIQCLAAWKTDTATVERASCISNAFVFFSMSPVNTCQY